MQTGAIPRALTSRLRVEHRFVIVGLFWLLAYAVLTLRSMLNPDSSGLVFSEPRLIATAAGGMSLLAVLILWDRLAMARLLFRVRMVILAVGAACAVMYGVRLFVAAQFGDFGATELADGGRWIIAWAGYFLAAVSATVAWQAVREMERLQAERDDLVVQPCAYECADALYSSIR